MIKTLWAVQSIYHKVVVQTAAGDVHTTLFYDDSEAEIRRRLLRQGQSLVELKSFAHRRIDDQFFSGTEKENFLRVFASFIRSGVNPPAAIRKSVSMIKNRKKRAQLQPAIRALNQGAPIAEAINSLPIFDNTTRLFLSAAVRVGAIQKIIEPLVAFRRERTAVWRRMATNLAFVSFELALAITSAIAMELQGFAFLQEQLGDTPDAQFNASLEIARLANRGLLVIGVLPFIYILTVLALLTSHNNQARLIAGRILDGTPLIRTLFRHLSIAETFAVASFSLSGGANFLTVCNDAINNSYIPTLRNYWLSVKNSHRGFGVPVTEAMASNLGPLTEWEQMPLAGHAATSNKDLADTLLFIAQERQFQVATTSTKITRTASLAIISYVIANVGIFVALLVAQDSQTQSLFQLGVN